MNPDTLNESQHPTDTFITEQYNLYAPALYGKILSIVHKGPIADKILEKVFVNMYINKTILVQNPERPLVAMLNHARDKSYKTVKALTLFRECCSGASISLTEKNGIKVPVSLLHFGLSSLLLG